MLAIREVIMKISAFFFFFIIVAIKCDDNVKFEELSRIIRPDVDEKTQQKAALDVIRRLIQDKADNVAVKVNFQLPSNYFKLRKTNNSDVLRIEANSGVSACKGFHHYIKYFCNGHISWDGHQLASIPDDDFPEVNLEMRASSQIVYYQNVCTHSYSYSFWTWNDWRRHIDWIALSGITLTLAPFQEDVWTEVFREYGLSQTDIDAHFAGVGFFAWQRMGNIRGWGGPLSSSFIAYASNLQQQMIKALNELGIAVALQAFDGHLPIPFKSIFPNASFTSTSQWVGFEAKYCCPLFIEPTDPLFTEIGEKFLSAMIRKYGTNHIYFSDPFNEVQPPAGADVNYLKNVSTSIYSGMTAVDPDAIWLLQGWFLVNNPLFWYGDHVKAFVTAVPKGKLLILDLQSEIRPQYNLTQSFYGQPFIWNMLHNFGGTLGMHGSIGMVNAEIPRAANELTNSTMVGVGITPEGIFQNYVVYQFALEKAWNYKEINHKKWIKFYARTRYGMEAGSAATSMAEHAWMLLLKSVYAYEGKEANHGKYVYCRRPTLKYVSWRWYDEKLIRKALVKLLTIAGDNERSNLYRRDLVDLTRQLLQLQAENIHVKIVDSFKKKNLQLLTSSSELFLDLLKDLDSLLATHEDFLLGKFLEAAKVLANMTSDQQTQYEFNARNQITLWGPNGEIIDYATKQWNGIVMDYYLPRWSLFLRQLKVSLETKTPFNQSKFQQDVFKQVELPFNQDRKVYPTVATGNAVHKANELLMKWKNVTFN